MTEKVDVMTLTDFLLARIGEDEARAQGREAALTMHWPECQYPGDMPGWCTCDLRAHVLAECVAKRLILSEAGHLVRGGDRQASIAGQIIVRALGRVYADHPDYLDEWRP